jgi:hypothetical protein
VPKMTFASVVGLLELQQYQRIVLFRKWFPCVQVVQAALISRIQRLKQRLMKFEPHVSTKEVSASLNFLYYI